MGLFKAIGRVFKGITKVVSAVGQLAKALGGILNSPLGNILKSIFPPLGLMSGVLNFAGMMGNLANQIGGGASYMNAAQQSNVQHQNYFDNMPATANTQYF